MAVTVEQWYRTARWLHQRQVPVLPSVITKMMRIVYACDLPYTVDLGPGVTLPHNGLGVVIHGDAKIGRGTQIFSNVTIGGNARGFGGIPVIKDDVYIGTGAVIIGPVVVGSRAMIGANAVVIHDVPDDYLAVGVPAVARPRSPQDEPA